MSDYEGFGVPPVPLMTPERARLVATGYKGLAEQLAQSGVPSEAARLERQSQWWLTYSIALALKPGEEGKAE